MTASSSALVRLAGIRFTYAGADFALNVAELGIERGERVAFVGPSGAGKTTLVHLIAGILVPDAGTVHLGATLLSSLPDAARRAERIARIGLVFQRFELLDYLSALENVLLPFRINPALRPTDEARERARDLIAATGLSHASARGPGQLSQGERQRVAICRALVTHPEVVICDEPTGNLDPATSASTLDLLFEQARGRDATVLMVTHDHSVLKRFDRVVDMEELAS